MRKNPPLLLFAIGGIGLLATTLIRAQQTAKTSPQANDVKTFPCLVLGAVRSPARLELRRQRRLSEILAIVGGVTNAASGVINVIHAERRDDQNSNILSQVYQITDLRNGDQKSNPYLEAGDIVIVTELERIYVIGRVVNPSELLLREPLTLTQAIKLAGGVRINAKSGNVTIHRQGKDAAGISIQVDLDAIRKHRAEDPVLQPYDVVEVPPLGPRKVGPPLSYPIFDTRPLIPPGYRVIY